MFSIKSLALFTTIALTAGVNAHAISARNNDITEPACPTKDFVPFKYVGCYNDPSTPNALQYNSYLDSTDMTIETCSGFCKGQGYKYAGLEYYGECYCGGAINGPKAPEASCSYACTGNSKEKCGGTDIISIWEDPTFRPVNPKVVTDYTFKGCYKDLVGNYGRSLEYQITPSIPNMTTEKCLAACKAEGYSYAGTEYADECYCGMNLGKGATVVPTSQCNMPCAGGAGTVSSCDAANTNCGGPALLSVYHATDLESLAPCGCGAPHDGWGAIEDIFSSFF